MTSQFPAFRHTVARQMAGYRQRLADRIDAEMGTRSWSVEDLAYKSGLSVKTIKRLQKAAHDPRRSTVRRLAEGFELDPAVLSPEAEADQLQRLEEKLDEILALLESDAKAGELEEAADEAKAEATPPVPKQREKPAAASR